MDYIQLKTKSFELNILFFEPDTNSFQIGKVTNSCYGRVSMNDLAASCEVSFVR